MKDKGPRRSTVKCHGVQPNEDFNPSSDNENLETVFEALRIEEAPDKENTQKISGSIEHLVNLLKEMLPPEIEEMVISFCDRAARKSLALTSYSLFSTVVPFEQRMKQQHQSELKRQLPSLVASGLDFTIAHRIGAGTLSWGYGENGELLQKQTQVYTPQKIIQLNNVNVMQISAGYWHVLLLTRDRELYSWGRDGSYQEEALYGRNTMSPKKILGLENYTVNKVIAGPCSSFIICDSGLVLSWGKYAGHDEKEQSVPKPIEGFHFRDIFPGATCCFAVDSDYHVYGWGSNFCGLLLHDRYEQQKPMRIVELDDFEIAKIAIGERHALFLTKDKKVYSWGLNNFGQLGLGSLTPAKFPTEIKALSALNVKNIYAQNDTSFAITEEGGVFSWGAGRDYLLGHGDIYDRTKPTKINFGKPDNTQIVHLSTGRAFTRAVSANGQCYTWGGGNKLFGVNMIKHEQVAKKPTIIEHLNILPKPLFEKYYNLDGEKIKKPGASSFLKHYSRKLTHTSSENVITYRLKKRLWGKK